MKKYVFLGIGAVLALILDCAVFAEWTILGVRPWMLLALSLAACMSLNVQSAILTALAGGLILDAVTNSYLGLTAACYLISVSALYLMTRKNHPKPLILWLFAALAASLWIPVEWFYSYLSGAHFGGITTVLTVLLPSAVLTGLLVLPLTAILNYSKKSHRDRI